MNVNETQHMVFPEGEDLSDILKMTGAGRFVPSFYVYKKNGAVEQVEIGDECILRIGTGSECDVVLDEPIISEFQVAIIRVGDESIFMDCGTQDIVQFNGIQRRQLIMPTESRVVMKIGSTWVVYVGIDYHVYDETDSVLLKRSLYAPSDNALGDILLQYNDNEWYSNGSPILIGSHNSCDFRIDSFEVKALQCIIYFTPDGLFIEDLTKGKPGIQVNGTPSIGIRPITEDITISFSGIDIPLYVYDDIKGQCKQLFQGLNRTPNLLLRDLQNPDTPPISLEESRQKLSIGRDAECNIVLDETSVSRKHAFLQPRGKRLHIMDNQSSNKTHINLQPVEKSTAIPGDIVGFGSAKFLLQYE
ncbi:MAG: FHA domain-containing protein [Lentisphaeraceae bacterium]|nr:FHA domain-containing protein [Lentisphaeraceae bacterium]